MKRAADAAVVGGTAFLAAMCIPRVRAALLVHWKHGAIMVAMLVVTYGLLRTDVPRRVAFSIVREDLRALMKGAGDEVGIFPIDAEAEDPRGGFCFRTVLVSRRSLKRGALGVGTRTSR